MTSATRTRTMTRFEHRAVLPASAHCAAINVTAKAAGIHRQRHYEWLCDPDYFNQFEETKAIAGQEIEDEAVERAMVGVFEPNVFQGHFVYPQEEYVVKP